MITATTKCSRILTTGDPCPSSITAVNVTGGAGQIQAFLQLSGWDLAYDMNNNGALPYISCPLCVEGKSFGRTWP